MTARVILPPKEHTCNPGWELGEPVDVGLGLYSIARVDPPADHVPEMRRRWHDLQLPEGAIWVCECGTSWVGYRPDGHVMSNSWRREGRFARRRRERNAS